MFNEIKECFRIMIIMIMCVSFSVNSMNACASEDDSSLLEYYINEKEKFQNISEQLYLGNISEEEFENQVNLLELNTTKMILAEKIYNKDVDAYSYYDDFAKDKFGVNAYEIALFKKYPAKAAKAITYASQASDLAKRLWKNWTLWQGNGDAFRHAFWSALMTIHIDKDFAYKESYAHEGIKLGTYSNVKDIDTKMDLENNHRGRDLGEIYKANLFNDNNVATCLLESEISGKLVRIREKTNSNSYDEQFYKLYGEKTIRKDYFIQTNKSGLK